MLIAGSLDLSALLASLAAQRPVFHSEADFQHSLAWTAHTMAPNLQVRLESQPEPSLHLDFLIARRDSDAATAIELKYLTHAWEGRCQGEAFHLKNRAVASWVKAHRECMAVAEQAAPQTMHDPLMEIRARVRAKRADLGQPS